MRRWLRLLPGAVQGLLAVAVVTSLASCTTREKLVEAACREDNDCEPGFLCEDFACIPAETKACDVVINGNPILQPSPHNVSMGEVDTAQATRTISLHNLGNCTLTLFEAGLANKNGSPFSCETCATAKFPLEIFPDRERPMEIKFQSTAVGTFHDELVLLSDDREYPEMRIPLSVNFLGVTDLRVTPFPVDFGYVAVGRMEPKAVQVTNQGTGVAPVVVEKISLSPKDTQDFTLVGVPPEPVTLTPVASDPTKVVSFEIQYHPRAIGKHAIEVVLQTSKGEVRVPVNGNSETPAKINVSPTSIDLGNVPLGQTNFQPLTIVNEGGAPLTVTYSWGGTGLSTDLFGIPNQLAPIAPGTYGELQVAVTATKVGPITGILLLSTNDPQRPQVSIPVSATGVPGAGPEVVKLELYYENGSDSAFDEDFRNVDMTLEHPYGFVCNKQNPKPSWGAYGNPSWIFFGPKEEPERIILTDATQDGTYRVMLQYQESCASLPTALLAGLLGVSVDVLQLVLVGGAVVPGKNIGELIEQVCLSRKSTEATVKVYINGALAKEQTVTLGKKGDVVFPIDLVRANGAFTAQ